jgi:multiple sugar transport system ATP-binding protein
MTMGDRVAVMRAGHLQQCDTPQTLYDHPNNIFVAAFIGSPAMNLYKASLSQDGAVVKLGSQAVSLPDVVAIAHPELASYRGRNIVVGLRPEHLPAAAAGGTGPSIEGDVDLVEALGSELLVHFNIDATKIHAEGAESDEEKQLTVSGEGVARLDPRTSVKAGDRARFEVDTERMQYFDAESGLAIW